MKPIFVDLDAQARPLWHMPASDFDVLAAPGDFHDWRDLAACASADPEAFFPEGGDSAWIARRVCQGCDVRAECLEWALAHGELFGIWGGVSAKSRAKLRQQRGVTA